MGKTASTISVEPQGVEQLKRYVLSYETDSLPITTLCK